MSTQGRPYQGYPYVNPVVIDVPSLDAASAAKWTNLPRRQIGTVSTTQPKQPNRPGTSQLGPGQEGHGTSQIHESNEAESRDRVGEESSKTDRDTEEDNPVVYIDIPDNNASCVIESPRSENANERTENAEAEGTILYDPFKDRIIEVHASADSSDDEDVTSSSPTRNRHFPPRPPPPSTLQVPSQGGSTSSNSSNLGSGSNSGIPAFMSKEAGYYGRLPTPDDGFLLAPIPVTDFPEPPPAYSEVDRVVRPNVDQATTPPRTEVVTTVTDPTSTIRPDSDRKLLQCQHCGQRVHSLVVRESGAFTHVLALIVAFLCLIPIVIIIYCTDSCKYKNHYCPNCNQLIGYEIPILCQQMAFV